MDVSTIDRKQRLQNAMLRSLSDEDLFELKSLFDEDIAAIAAQLDLAKGKAQSKREYADPTWYASTTFAKKMRGQASQAIQAELGRRRRERGDTQNGGKFEKALLEAMDTLLTPDMKEQVMELARSKVGN